LKKKEKGENGTRRQGEGKLQGGVREESKTIRTLKCDQRGLGKGKKERGKRRGKSLGAGGQRI